MDIEIWIRLAVIVLLLALSAFFSSSESAFFSLSRAILNRLEEGGDPRGRRVARLMSNPRRFLATILTGNTIVNTGAAALAALITVELAAGWGVDSNLAVVVEVIVVTILILFLAELLPKLFALRNAERWALRASSGMVFCWHLLSPVAIPLSLFTGSLSKLFGIERQSMLAMTEDEIRALVELGHEHGQLELEERKMIHSIVEFGDTTAREVMVPRIDMVAVERHTPVDQLVQTVISKGHSRIPIYEKSIDNVVGLIHGKDLLDVARSPEKFDLQKILRPAYFVPEEKKLDDLLKEFQTNRMHMAIVVDEYGGTAGLVTLEDIIEEIFGEIQDEHDREQPLMRKADDGAVTANAKVGISDFNEWMEHDLIPEDDAYESLGGFVYAKLGEVPHKGQEFEFEGWRFIVDEVFGKRIKTVRVVRDDSVFDDDRPSD